MNCHDKIGYLLLSRVRGGFRSSCVNVVKDLAGS